MSQERLEQNNPNSELRSRIDFQHILRELSENRKDPCEVIRELISNSHDADASSIKIFPLLQYQGFIFFDNGVGLSETREDNGIIPYESFFSVGKSTKKFGESIGYKCQGSKLCFDSKKFALITRCQPEPEWRWIKIDNPKDNLDLDYPLSSQKTISPWKILSELLLHPDERSSPIIEKLSKEFFVKEFSKGTMIIVQDLNVDNFSTYYGMKSNKYSYLKNYISFNTRHGDVRTLRPEKTGFSQAVSLAFRKDRGYRNDCELFLWLPSGKPLLLDGLEQIQSGYPYLDKAPEGFKLPVSVTRLFDGRFCSRYAKMIRYEDRDYCLILAIDGNRRIHNEYSELDRRGSKRSGIRLTDQRGTFICSQGVKVCRYEKFYETSELSDYSQLATDDGHRHYAFMINGNFRLVTNRNSLTEDAEKTLNNKEFIGEIKKFLDETRRNDRVFRELVDRLNQEHIADRLDDYTRQLEERKNNLKNRIRFFIKGIKTTGSDIHPIEKFNPQLSQKIFVEPQLGEEHGVGALYFLLSHLVLPDSPYKNLWLRPLTFSGIGIDSITVGDNENKPLVADTCKTIEYKFNFTPDTDSSSDNPDFNHPLIHTDHILLWEFESFPKENSVICDAFKHFGRVRLSPNLENIGYEIVNISGQDGSSYPGTVKVISLKKLIEQTFECDWITPPPPKDPFSSSHGRKGKK
jgi:hypothetical protein